MGCRVVCRGLGVAADSLAGKVLRRTALSPGSVAFYDRCVVPIARCIESLWHAPIGQSLIAAAMKYQPGMRRAGLVASFEPDAVDSRVTAEPSP